MRTRAPPLAVAPVRVPNGYAIITPLRACPLRPPSSFSSSSSSSSFSSSLAFSPRPVLPLLPLRPPRGTPGDEDSSTSTSADDDLDPTERFVGALFGKKTLEDPEPAGLRRLTYESTPELFAPDTTRGAPPHPTDTPSDAREGHSGRATIRPLLAGTQLEALPLDCVYYSARAGCEWSPRAFHAAVDARGAGVVLIYTAEGDICGGYNPRGWVGLGEDRDAIAAFLFCNVPEPDGRRGAAEAEAVPGTVPPLVKLPKVGGPGIAVVDKPDAGPQVRFVRRR